ncbi:hypothetical protein FMUND_5466 [Fusarium mundagurra]|uniref:Uncharacterized protein n=1 Tax=Fusarium mundagurra TaxID=1567541 RepID=A0A8H5YSZ6_9HYPO|nr:hypothetical protein FMUND_5466 [Fusarium mundagurra]
MASSSELPTWYYRISDVIKKRNGVILWDFDEDITDFDETNPDETRKETIRKRKEDAREEEENKIEQVRAAYEALQISMSKSESTPLGPIDSQFDLYRMDYFDCFYDPSLRGYQSRYIRFEYEDTGEAHSDSLNGRFWLNPKIDFELLPFKAPESSSLEYHEIYDTGGKFPLKQQFIDKGHLILRASRHLVFWGAPQDPRGPETFICVGARNDWGK